MLRFIITRRIKRSQIICPYCRERPINYNFKVQVSYNVYGHVQHSCRNCIIKVMNKCVNELNSSIPFKLLEEKPQGNRINLLNISKSYD